jgi:hypothetical protein
MGFWRQNRKALTGLSQTERPARSWKVGIKDSTCFLSRARRSHGSTASGCKPALSHGQELVPLGIALPSFRSSPCPRGRAKFQNSWKQPLFRKPVSQLEHAD